VLAFVGPTASGKSEVGLEIADRHGGEIVSVDSMQVYRGMDIGTAKATWRERKRVPHHLVDLVEPEHGFSVAEFQAAGRRALDGIAAADAAAIVVGGSGLHFRSLVDPLDFPPSNPTVRSELEDLGPQAAVEALLAADPEAGNVVDLANPRRVVRALEVHRMTGQTPSQRQTTPAAVAVREYRSRLPLVVIGLDPGPDLAARVERRFDRMLEAGLLNEVAQLAPRLGVTAAQAVGYKQLLPVVRGERTIDQGRRDAIDATRALAGRQRTFFGRDPRIRWLEWDDDPLVRLDRATGILEELRWTS
jgi:tRNA dimethylallyltransferase